MKLDLFIKGVVPVRMYYSIMKLYYRMRYPQYKKMVKSNRQLKNSHTGEKCYILGNGPSLSNVDFALLANEFTFSVNQLPRKKEYPKLKTNYHMWADPQFFQIDKNRVEDVELIEVMEKVNSENNKPMVFYPCYAEDMLIRTGLNNKLDIHYFQDINAIYDLDKVLKRQVDYSSVVPCFRTVVIYAICLAIYMGFSKIILLGCECTAILTDIQTVIGNKNPQQYGYIISENEKKRMEKNRASVSLADKLKTSGRLLEEYEMIANYAKRFHIKIYNATEGGLLESFPRISFNDSLKL